MCAAHVVSMTNLLVKIAHCIWGYREYQQYVALCKFFDCSYVNGRRFNQFVLHKATVDPNHDMRVAEERVEITC
jgi:hypothetical protein